jgi:DNA-binding NtrC family response regulator
MNVLLIEDNNQFRALLREFLEAMGGTVTEAESPTFALHIPMEKFNFDLIVTDMDFVGLDGLSFIEYIERTIGRHRVMFMSGTDHRKRIHQKCAECPETVWDFARKPFSRQGFQLKVGSLLARNPS